MKKIWMIPLAAGLALLCACKGKNATYEAVNNASADSAKADTNTGSQPKLVKTAQAHFKVKSVQKTGEEIAALTAKDSGMVMHHDMASTAGRSEDIMVSNDSVMRVTAFSTTANMTVKIPPAKLEDFINQVTRMGVYVNNSTMDITDKSLDYLSTQLKLKNRSEFVSDQKKAGISEDPTTTLNFRDDLVDRKLGNKRIDDDVKSSIVSLSFYESDTIKKEMMANNDPSAYDLPFFKRLGMAVMNGCSMFGEVLIAIANLWVFVLAAILVWLGVRYYRNRVVVKV